MPRPEYMDALPYDPPNATDADRKEVDRLLKMRKLRRSKEERQQLIAIQKPYLDTLEDLVRDHDPERKRFASKHANGPLHNQEYLISIYMDHVGRPEAVPDSWRTPTPYKPGVACKIRQTMPAKRARPARDEGESLQFDPLDTSRYALCHSGVANVNHQCIHRGIHAVQDVFG